MRHLRFFIDFLENGWQANVFAHGLGAGVQVVCDLLNMLGLFRLFLGNCTNIITFYEGAYVVF